MTFDCIVIGSHLRYDGVWQRPHHVATRLGRTVPVLFVEEPFLAVGDADAIEVRGAVCVLRPMRHDPTATAIDAATIAAVRRWVAGRRALVWLYTPAMNVLASAFDWQSVVYDCMDDLASFAGVPAGLRESEIVLLERSHVVFAGGRSLYERRRSFGSKVLLFPSGVEIERFAAANEVAPHRLFAHLGHPVCGYAGVIDERVDFAVLEALADRPVEIVLVGPVTKIDGAVLPRRTNVHFTGQMPYAEVPALFAGFDVALLPLARNAATASISPTKTPEYLAAGLPVVSTPIADVVAEYSGVVTFADDPSGYADACLAAVPVDGGRIRRGIALVRAADWDAIVARMVAALESE